MQAYSAYAGYCKNGIIIPMGNPDIPEMKKVIITVLEEEVNFFVQSQKRSRKELAGSLRSETTDTVDDSHWFEPMEELEDYM